MADSSLKRSAPFDANLCFICQTHKRDPRTRTKRDSACNVPEQSIPVVKARLVEWKKKKKCTDQIAAALVILDEVFASTATPTLKWHRLGSCRSNFMSQQQLDRFNSEHSDDGRVMDISGSAIDQESNQHYLRSQALPYQKFTHCVMCCCGEERGELMPARTFKTHDKLEKLATTDYEMFARMQDAHDVMAADVLYHINCLRTRMRDDDNEQRTSKDKREPIYDQLRREIQVRMYQRQAVLVSDCWARFKELSDERGIPIPYYFAIRRAFFKEKLKQLIPTIEIIPRQSSDLDDDIIIPVDLTMSDRCEVLKEHSGDTNDLRLPPYNNSEMNQMVHVALYLRRQIMDHPRNTNATLTEENAYASVPEALYVFMALMHSGSDALEIREDVDEFPDERDKAAKLRSNILDVCQDLTYTISGGRIIPPKQFSLGLTVHQLSGRSKKLVNILHKARQVISYDQCQQADTAMAEDTLENIDPVTGAVTPKSLVRGKPIQFGADNIDCNKESAKVGHSAGYHGTQMVVYQAGPGAEVDVSEIRFSKRTLAVPRCVHEILELATPYIKEPPYVLTKQDVDIILDRSEDNHGKKIFNLACAKDLAFNLRRQNLDRAKDAAASWTEHNKKQSEHQEVPATTVGQMPLLNAKADDHDTINTVVERGRVISRYVGDPHIWYTTDQAINAPAHETKWTRGAEWDNVHFKMGGLHSSNNYMGTIGDHIADSELPQIWVEAEIVTQGLVDKILKGKDYKAGLRLHKITWQAMWRIVLPQFLEHVKSIDGDVYMDLYTLSHNSDTFAPLLTRVNTSEVLGLLNEFLTIKRQDKNFAFLWTYVDMVQILLAFTRASRDEDWVLHLYSFTQMLDSFMRYDHQKYAKWGIIYVVDMYRLPADVLDRFQTGFGVQWRDNSPFTDVDIDHATEWVNGLAKSTGGLADFTQTDSATLRWVLSFHKRSVIASQTQEYYGIDTSPYTKATPSQLKREALYEDQLVAKMIQYKLFDGGHPEKLTTLITKDVVPAHIEESLLQSAQLGHIDVRNFMLQRLVKGEESENPTVAFTATMTKIKSATFSNLYDVEKQLGNPQTQVMSANRKVLQRLVAAFQAQRKPNMEEVAQHELMSVPLSLFNTDQTMRKGPKSSLMDAILKTTQVSCSSSIPPVPPFSSQHVVDGMGQVYKINPIRVITFGDFCDHYTMSVYAMPSQRIDVCFDRYDGTSTKDDTRGARASVSKCGKMGKKQKSRPAIPRVIAADVPLPKGADYKAFLTLKENKIALQKFLGDELMENAPRDKTIVVSGAFLDPLDVRASEPVPPQMDKLKSDHEEADTRIILSILHSDAPRCVVVARDTDVFIILLAHHHLFNNKQVYFFHGTAKEKKYVDVGTVADALLARDINPQSLPLLHALSGCDTTSYPYGIGKATAWKAFLKYKELLDSINVRNPSDADFKQAEIFMCRMWGDPEATSLNSIRTRTLLTVSKPEDNPPTSDAAKPHISRAFQQTAKWVNSSEPIHENLPTPVSSGGFKEVNGKLVPVLMTLDPIPQAVIDIVSCNCEGACQTRRCACVKAGLSCTIMCHKGQKHHSHTCMNHVSV